jgi:hypothetical protein
MKSRKQKAKTSIKDIIRETFMQSPIPMSISTEDGTYIEINEAAIKYVKQLLDVNLRIWDMFQKNKENYLLPR